MTYKNKHHDLTLPLLLLGSYIASAYVAVQADPYANGATPRHHNVPFTSSSNLALNPPTLSLNSSSSTCDETYGFLPCTTTVVGNLFLILAYGCLMSFSAHTLSSGSEHMLERLGPGLIGGIVLPILSTFPNAMLVLVSGLGGSTDSAQSQVIIGIGYLAGTTVLSLTVMWGSCVVAGKCDLHTSNAVDQTDTRGFSLTGSGVSTEIWSGYTARIMAASVTPFLVVQIPQALSSSSAKHIGVLVAFIFSLSTCVSYCLYQVVQPWIQHRRMEYVKHKNNKIDELAQHLRPSASSETEDGNDLEQPGVGSGGGGGLIGEFTRRSLVVPAVKLVAGTAVAAAFSDPLVGAVGDFSSATGIPSFFISFVILPLATCSTHLISSIVFARNKTRKSSSLNFEMIYGSVTMNNVLSMSVFLGIVYIRDLTWEFSAESVVVLVVCLAVGGLGSFRTKFPLWTSLSAFTLYPFSLVLYYILYYICGWS